MFAYFITKRKVKFCWLLNVFALKKTHPSSCGHLHNAQYYNCFQCLLVEEIPSYYMDIT